MWLNKRWAELYEYVGIAPMTATEPTMSLAEAKSEIDATLASISKAVPTLYDGEQTHESGFVVYNPTRRRRRRWWLRGKKSR